MRIARALALLPIAVAAACSEAIRAPEAIDAVPIARVVAMPPRATPVARPVAPRKRSDETEPVAPARGMELFARHCAGCHGEGGLGDGPAAAWLEPHPWRFAGAMFKLGTTVGGSPSDDDLRRTIEGGIPGTAMPGFAQLVPADLRDLVLAVRHLTLVATVAQIESAESSYSRAEALAAARDLVAPGVPIELPPRPVGESDAPDVVHVYEQRCVECHAKDGTGRGAEDEKDLRDVFGFETGARDLTRDPLKGGASAEDVARRIARGMPGTPMPQARLEAPAFWAVVDQVMRFRAGAPAAPVYDATLVAAKCDTALPATPGAVAWNHVRAERLAVRRLRARAGGPADVEVRALHDGARIAIRLSWRTDAPAASGAALRLVRAGESRFGLGDDATSRAETGRWPAGEAAASGAPGSEPPSKWPAAVRGLAGTGVCLDGDVSVVFVGDLPAGAADASAAELSADLWSGLGEDGRALESFVQWQRVELGR